MKNLYEEKVRKHLMVADADTNDILTEEDLSHLPGPVQKYIRFTGSIGKEKIKNFRVEFAGGIRSNPTDKYMKIKTVQYNFIDKPARIFYLRSSKMGIPVSGIHLYENEKAFMKIKLAGLLTIVNARGPEMNQGETVTLFNDMCMMAPASLINRNIEWKKISDTLVHARFTNGSISIEADLVFDETGALINFKSNDRYHADGKEFINYPWHTPVTGGYKDFNGYFLPSSAKMVYKRKDGDFCYGEFDIKTVEYNCRELR